MSDLDNVRPRAWIRDEHAMKMTDAINPLQEAVQNGLAKDRGQYYAVAVLFIHWSNDGVIGLESGARNGIQSIIQVYCGGVRN